VEDARTIPTPPAEAPDADKTELDLFLLVVSMVSVKSGKAEREKTPQDFKKSVKEGYT
jgi:hypothetical protein